MFINNVLNHIVSNKINVSATHNLTKKILKACQLKDCVIVSARKHFSRLQTMNLEDEAYCLLAICFLRDVNKFSRF